MQFNFLGISYQFFWIEISISFPFIPLLLLLVKDRFSLKQKVVRCWKKLVKADFTVQGWSRKSSLISGSLMAIWQVRLKR